MGAQRDELFLQLCATSHRVSVAPHIFAELLGGVPTTRDTRLEHTPFF